jgi:hypothetical protein
VRTRAARLLASLLSSFFLAPVLVPVALASSALAAAAARADGLDHVVLKPQDRAGWSPAQLFAALRPDYHSDRTLRVETSPPGASLDLFYVRASFQKRYEQARAPALIELPTRAEAGSRDSVTIRAYLPGRKIATIHIPVRSSQDKVLIELDPLDNTLVAVANTYFAGREGLSFLLKQPATLRVQKAEDGFSLILAQTSVEKEAQAVLAGVRSPMIASIDARQLGEDLLVAVKLVPGLHADGLELRSREQAEPARDLYRDTVDMVPKGQVAADIERARTALDRITPGDVTGCALAFDATLRSQLDPEQLARALAPRGDFTDPYLHAALRRLGEVSPGGVIALAGGARYRPGVPLELAAAASQASAARGYLALLRQWVRLLDPAPYRTEALRSLVAPEMDPATFAAALSKAEAAEGRCRPESADRTPPATTGERSSHPRRAGGREG